MCAMTIAFACPSCKQPYHVPDELGGRTTRCKKCNTAMMIPHAEVGMVHGVGKKRRPGVNFAMGIGGVLLLGALAFGISYGVKEFFLSSGLSGDELKFLPDGCQ